MKQPANGSEAGCQRVQVCHLWALGEVRGMRGTRTSCLCRGGQHGARSEGGNSVERIMVYSKGRTAAPHLEEERLSCVGVQEAQLLLWGHSFI